MQHTSRLVLLALSLGGCDAPDAPASPVAALQLFAFPREVEPSGECTIVVQVSDPDCATVCLGLPAATDGGGLFPPPGVNVAAGSSISLPVGDAALLSSITYVAPDHEGSEVVSAACFAGTVDCSQGQPPASVKSTTSTRIVIRSPSPPAGGGGMSTTGGQPGTGGEPETGGTPDQSSGGAAGTQ